VGLASPTHSSGFGAPPRDPSPVRVVFAPGGRNRRGAAVSEAMRFARSKIPAPTVRTCAWCDDVWLGKWLPRSVAVGRLGASRVADCASHGICEACLAAQLEELAAASRAA
jgi:hypothetical protein